MPVNSIYIFGAGKKTNEIIRSLPSGFFAGYLRGKIKGIVDNDCQKHGTCLFGLKVFSANILQNEICCEIVISSIYYQEIEMQLREQFGIAEERIKHIEEYIIEEYVKYQYDKNMKKIYLSKQYYQKKFNPHSLVVYTVITNNYDRLKDPCKIDKDFKYVCFTDNRDLKSSVWEIRYIDTNMENDDNLHLDRKIKILPHRYLHEFETSIWLDASFEIIGDLRWYMGIYQRNSDILLCPHYARECIYDEVAACMIQRKAEKEKLLKQMSWYLEEGYPIDNGLFLGGFIVRNHNVETVKKIMEEWWAELCSFSHRDQISLPYVLWKNRYLCDVSDIYCLKNDWIHNGAHAR